MFETLLKTMTSPEEKKKANEFAEFQKKFTKFEKAMSPMNSKTKRDMLYGRSYNSK